MSYTTTNVIVGAASIWTAPINTVPPLTSLAAGTPWLAPWVSVGATDAGLTMGVELKTVPIMIEEQPSPVDMVVDTEDVTFAFTLSEDTLASMQLAYGGGTLTVTAPSSILPGTSSLALSPILGQVAIGFEALNTFGLARRIVIPAAVTTAKVDTAYRRAKAARLYPVTLTAVCPVGSISIVEITAAAL